MSDFVRAKAHYYVVGDRETHMTRYNIIFLETNTKTTVGLTITFTRKRLMITTLGFRAVAH